MRAEDRIKKLRNLKHGWFTKDSGEPINDVLIQFLLKSLKKDRKAWECLRVADILPTLEGSIELEWHTKKISTYLIFSTKIAYYIELDHTDGLQYKGTMDINNINFWEYLWDRVEFNLNYK